MVKTCSQKSKNANKPGYICNPTSGIWVKKSGPTGQKVLAAMKLGVSPQRKKASPKKVTKKTSPKKVVKKVTKKTSPKGVARIKDIPQDVLFHEILSGVVDWKTIHNFCMSNKAMHAMCKKHEDMLIKRSNMYKIIEEYEKLYSNMDGEKEQRINFGANLKVYVRKGMTMGQFMDEIEIGGEQLKYAPLKMKQKVVNLFKSVGFLVPDAYNWISVDILGLGKSLDIKSKLAKEMHGYKGTTIKADLKKQLTLFSVFKIIVEQISHMDKFPPNTKIRLFGLMELRGYLTVNFADKYFKYMEKHGLEINSVRADATINIVAGIVPKWESILLNHSEYDLKEKREILNIINKPYGCTGRDCPIEWARFADLR